MQGKKNYVYRLKRSLYGLKQSPSQGYERFDEFIFSYGYIRSPCDSRVYHSKVEDGSHIYLLLYVNNILITSKDKFKIQNLKSLFSIEFKIKDLRAA